jgi:Family of unknown function (DUF6508)
MDEGLEALHRLASYEQVFAAPGFSVGSWAGGERDASGVIQVPYYELSDEMTHFTRDMAALGWVRPFDWMSWSATPRGQQLITEPAAIGTATAEELANLLTTIIRGERFSDGEIEGAFRRGSLLAIMRRAGALARSETDTPS